MEDTQNRPDYRDTPIDKVGIKDLKYPIKVLDRENGTQQTIGSLNMYVNLPHDNKGTHMSRFVEMLHMFQPEISLKTFSMILDQMKNDLEAQSAHMEVTFPYFIEKKAPVSRTPAYMEYTCKLTGTSTWDGRIDLISEVIVPITSVCPCSKEISDGGAHNQRGEVRLAIRFKKFIWIEDMIERVERCASCDLYSVLKRADEKHVTDQGYNNPKFVEDIVRDIAVDLKADPNITWFSISVENFESIHNHSAYATITRGERPLLKKPGRSLT